MIVSDIVNRICSCISPITLVGSYIVARRHHDLFVQGITEYDFRGIDKNSIVLDLGASVGGFSIHAAKRCKMVYSVEPLFTDFLNDNLQLNKIENCNVIPYAISDREYTGTLSFYGTEKEVRFLPFEKILALIPEHIDFLKCDIEGAERYVNFGLFENIEAELHNRFTVNNVNMYHKRNGVEVNLLQEIIPKHNCETCEYWTHKHSCTPRDRIWYCALGKEYGACNKQGEQS